MSDQDRRETEAKERLGVAGRQGKHAAKNTARAVQLGAEIATEEAKDALSHAADRVEDVAAEVVDDTKRGASRISTGGLAAISNDLGVGFLATSVSIYSGLVAYYKFRAVIQGRGRAVK